MSYSIDVNILLYASDSSSPSHAAAGSFLREKTSEPEVLYIAWPTALAYLRISTHPQIFDRPLAPPEALTNLERLLALPRVRAINERDGFLESYKELTDLVPTRGNLVPDAHLAAILHQHGVRTLYTNDSDFRKFDFLDVRNPL